jgi:hypothetical protein
VKAGAAAILLTQPAFVGVFKRYVANGLRSADSAMPVARAVVAAEDPKKPAGQGNSE